MGIVIVSGLMRSMHEELIVLWLKQRDDRQILLKYCKSSGSAIWRWWAVACWTPS